MSARPRVLVPRERSGDAVPEPVAQASRPPGTRTAWLLATALAAFAAAVQWWLVRDLRQLPSPVLGGDWAYQEACIRAILLSGNPLAAPSSGHSLPGYMPLYGTLVAAVVRLTGLGVEPVMLGMSVVNHVAGTLIVFAVIRRHFGERAGLLMSALWQWGHVGLVVKYTEFTSQLLVPLYFDALLLWLRSARKRNALYLGLVIAALGYAHAVAFVSGIVVAFTATAIAAIPSPGAPADRPGALVRVRGLAVVAACALLALGYWYRPLFEFHGHTSPHYAEWNGGESVGTLGERLGFAGRLLARSTFPADLPGRVLNAVGLLGAAALVMGSRRQHRAVALVSVLVFAWIFHFLLTVPLLHTHFVPEYVRRMLWTFAPVLLAAVAAEPLLGRVPAGRAWLVTAVTLVAFAAGGIAWEARGIARDPAMVEALSPLPAHMLAMQRWALAHTGKEDVVLSTNELSYAWSALTGRKNFVARRAQNDPFLDLDARNRDAALMLYGHNDARRRELLASSHVSWLLWTQQWVGTEYVQVPGGLSTVDPLLYFANPAWDEELRADSVVVRTVYTWVDPFLRGPDYPEFDLTLIAPQNYRSFERPWNAGLDAYLEPAWEYREQGQLLAALYRVRAPLHQPATDRPSEGGR